MRLPAALMYHALYASERERDALEPEERPYALSRSAFEAHLDALSDTGIAIADPVHMTSANGGQRHLVLTFDDGHLSNALIATEVLAAREMKAIFFLTAGHIGNRRSACSWEHVREMQRAGMTIGAHGYTHRFISELSANEASDELTKSKSEIEQHLGVQVQQMSFPGGMYRARDIDLAKAAGYRACYTSDVIYSDTRHRGGPVIVPRFAVRSTDKATLVVKWVKREPLELARLRCTYWVKRTIRKILGARIYHRAYQLRAEKR